MKWATVLNLFLSLQGWDDRRSARLRVAVITGCGSFMPRNISFAMTMEQVKNKTKTVTRRLGWWRLKPGTLLQPVEKSIGLKKGEKVKKIGGLILVVSVRWELLNAITKDDVEREGFPEMNCDEFISFFCQGYHLTDGGNTVVNRIEFKYL